MDIPDELACPLCADLLVAPVRDACGHVFCRHCLVRWRETSAANPTCPLSRLPQAELPPADPALAQRIEELLPVEYRRRLREAAAEPPRQVQNGRAWSNHIWYSAFRGQKVDIAALERALQTATHVSLADTTGAGDVTVQRIVRGAGARLVHLDLTQVPITHKAMTKHLREIGGTLRSLIMASCYHVTSRAFKGVAQEFSALTRLDIARTDVGPSGIQAIALGMTNLEWLELADTRVNDGCIVQIAESLGHLKRLGLQGAKRVTSVAPLARVATLEELDVSWAPKLEEDSLIAALEGLQRLQTLNIRGCTGMTDRLGAALLFCPRLYHFDAMETMVTRRVLLAIHEACPDLYIFITRDCLLTEATSAAKEFVLRNLRASGATYG